VRWFLKKSAVILLVSFVAVSSGAANWVESGSNPEKGVYTYVDTESISTQGKYKQAFTKYISIPKEFYLISFISYDCKSKPIRRKLTYSTLYNLEGTVISSSEITNSSFLPAIPDSIGEIEANIICNL
jgi:hypothetical protein